MRSFMNNSFVPNANWFYKICMCATLQCIVKAKTPMALFVVLLSVAIVDAQNFTSNGNGQWITGSNWVAGTAAPTVGQNWGITRVNNTLTVNGNFDFQASGVASGVKYGLEIGTGGNVTINGNFSISNGAVVNVYGKLNITGNAALNADLNIYPGGKVIVSGDVTIINSNYLTVGTNVVPNGSYADLVIKNNLVSQNSGDIVIERNARVVIFKNFISNTAGGTIMTIKNGGQIYINGNIALTGGGDNVTNGNGINPIGFYVNGTVTAAGGGAAVDSNRGNKITLFTNDRPFYDWVASQPNSPLPIALVYLNIQRTANESASLNWATSFEENFDRFIIQRSANGVSFESIGEVIGAGTGKTTLRYSFVDETPLSNKSYYRLQSMDKDGSFEYSKIIFIEFEPPTKSVVFYPNPSTGESISYSINSDLDGNEKMVIINSIGEEIVTASMLHNNEEIIFNKHLPPGVYIINFRSVKAQESVRLIVR